MSTKDKLEQVLEMLVNEEKVANPWDLVEGHNLYGKD